MNKYKAQSSLPMMSDASDANDERLGAALSRGLAGPAEFQQDPYSEFPEVPGCPTAEEIAALIQGVAPAKERDRLLKHISACADCYESFMLALELHKETKKETPEDKHKIIFLRPLALAASVLIVIFTVYLVFRSGGMPKTTRDLENYVALEEANETRSRPEEKVLREPLRTPAATDAERLEKDKKEETKTDNRSFRLSKPAPALPPPPAAKRQMTKAKIAEASGATAPASPEPLTETPKEAEETGKKEPVLGVTAKIERPDDEIAAKPSLSYMDGQDRSAPGKKGGSLQQQTVILNQQVQQINSYLPQAELADLFNQTINLAQQMEKETRDLDKETAASRDDSRMNTYTEGAKPLLKVTVVADKVKIFPDIQWFLSRSTPGTLEHRFFSLARSGGWCLSGNLCTMGKLDPSETKKLLAQWQELEPQLTGIFKQIAGWTISHLAD